MSRPPPAAGALAGGVRQVGAARRHDRPDGYLSVDALWRQPGYGLSYGIGGLSALGLGLRPGGWQKLEQLLALPLLTPVDEGREKLALPAYEQTLRLLERGLEKDGDPLAT